jgi:hypothetical protein
MAAELKQASREPPPSFAVAFTRSRRPVSGRGAYAFHHDSVGAAEVSPISGHPPADPARAGQGDKKGGWGWPTPLSEPEPGNAASRGLDLQRSGGGFHQSQTGVECRLGRPGHRWPRVPLRKTCRAANHAFVGQETDGTVITTFARSPPRWR